MAPLSTPALPTASWEDICRIVFLDHHDPFQVLGMHPVTIGKQQAVAVRAFLPGAREAAVLLTASGQKYSLTKVHQEGFWETIIPDPLAEYRREIDLGDERYPYYAPTAYQLERIDEEGQVHRFYDSYAFAPVLTRDDLYLFNEGTNYRIYEKMGARPMTLHGIGGVHFALWAPHARRISVVGDFNQWDGRRHCMRARGRSGLWELFVPGLQEGELYKFEIKAYNHFVFMKTDPYALRMEIAPKTASVVHVLDKYQWQDKAWMSQRQQFDYQSAPLAIYEVHLGSWRRVPEEHNRPLTYREAAPLLIEYVKDMGYTHIEFLPLSEHPFGGSWGYQCSGYFAPTSRYGPPEDLMCLIDQCHQNDIGVILDWVPAHFPKDAHALARFDGTPLYEHADPRRGEHQDWGTLIFNYGRREVKNFLLANALFWFEKYHIDGLRIDAVASMLYLDYSRRPGEWVPNIYGGRENLEAVAFLKELNDLIHSHYPGALIMAEESTSWPQVTGPTYLGGLGFDLKWNMGWMNDLLAYISMDPLFRSYHQGKITFSIFYAFNENFILPLSHDEVVHLKRSLIGKMPGDLWQQFANLRVFLGFMFTHPGKKLLFMGNDIAQWAEWNHDASLDWHLLDYAPHRQFHAFMRDLLHLYRREAALHQIDFNSRGFQWIDFHDAAKSIIAFMRKSADRDDFVVVVCNFTPVPRWHYRIGVPLETRYREILNSDAAMYGGSNLGNLGAKQADKVPQHDFPYSLDLLLPPLAILILKPEIQTPVSESALALEPQPKKSLEPQPKKPLEPQPKETASAKVPSAIQAAALEAASTTTPDGRRTTSTPKQTAADRAANAPQTASAAQQVPTSSSSGAEQGPCDAQQTTSPSEQSAPDSVAAADQAPPAVSGSASGPPPASGKRPNRQEATPHDATRLAGPRTRSPGEPSAKDGTSPRNDHTTTRE